MGCSLLWRRETGLGHLPFRRPSHLGEDMSPGGALGVDESVDGLLFGIYGGGEGKRAF